MQLFKSLLCLVAFLAVANAAPVFDFGDDASEGINDDVQRESLSLFNEKLLMFEQLLHLLTKFDRPAAITYLEDLCGSQ